MSFKWNSVRKFSLQVYERSCKRMSAIFDPQCAFWPLYASYINHYDWNDNIFFDIMIHEFKLQNLIRLSSFDKKITHCYPLSISIRVTLDPLPSRSNLGHNSISRWSNFLHSSTPTYPPSFNRSAHIIFQKVFSYNYSYQLFSKSSLCAFSYHFWSFRVASVA